ncbi:MAG TPA: class I SAM-dependent methyltransferase [Verrucomicrobiae bacterium]|nr:class I SAM-dependent methyltransferase [Verrucomicrobiae bacterium]
MRAHAADFYDTLSASADAAADAADADALLALGRWLQGKDYTFTTVTPATHARVVARNAGKPARDLRGAFGWSLPFRRDLLPAALLGSLLRTQLLERAGDDLLRSRVRASTLDGLLLFHSSFPTRDADAVFLGPDTYRFANLIKQVVPQLPAPPRHVVDLGCGTGAGGLVAGRLLGPGTRIRLADLNARAMQFAAVNAALAEQRVACSTGDLLAPITGPIDLVIANPPYLTDAAVRTYRDGGGRLGSALSLRIVRETLRRLEPGGHLLLYTASAIVEGRDLLREQIELLLRNTGASFDYVEIDPDVFGEELDTPAYAQVERIAVVQLLARRATGGA